MRVRPLESTLIGVVGESEIRAHEGRDLGDDPDVVYLLEGGELGYGRSIVVATEDSDAVTARLI